MRFSIIVPVYKIKEQELKKCIDSLIAQKYPDLEIILVDDGSPDNCGDLIDTYASLDSRIIGIHQKNQGVSAARNHGLGIAKGEYVLFVDGDDFLIPNIISQLATTLKNMEPIDILYFYYQNASQIQKHKLDSNPKIQYLSEKDRQIWFQSNIQQIDLIPNISIGSPWGKVFSMSFLKEHTLQFPIGVPRTQDRVFMAECLSNAKKISYINICGYIYNDINDTSATHRFNPNILNDLELAGKHLESLVQKQSFLDDLQKKMLCVDFRFKFMLEWELLFFLHRNANMSYRQMKSYLVKTYMSYTFQYLITHSTLTKEEITTRDYGVIFNTIIEKLKKKQFLQLYLMGLLFRYHRNK